MNKIQILNFTIQFVVILGNFISYAIIGRVIVSWFTMGRMGGRGRLVQILYDVTDPVINLAKKLPHHIGMMDLSPIIALLGVELIVWIVVNLLYKLA
jgi:YggT family protein